MARLSLLIFVAPDLICILCIGSVFHTQDIAELPDNCLGLSKYGQNNTSLVPGVFTIISQILALRKTCVPHCDGEYSYLFIPKSPNPGSHASCYAFYPDEWVTYVTAKKLCESTLGHVGALETEDEDNHVKAIIRENELYVSGLTPTWCGYWMCGSDSKEESRWIWEFTNLPFNYTNWVPGEPGNIALNEDGVVISMQDLKWVDVKKTSPFAVFCEKQPVCQ